MPDQEPMERPHVRVPAPFIVLFFVLVGEFIEVHVPYPIESSLLFFLGWLCLVLATGGLLWCFSLFMQARTTIMPANPVQRLVVEGPYRVSRNPMYVTLCLFHIGYAMATGNPWGLLTLAGSVTVLQWLVIRPEEEYLHSRFESEYRAYCARVRRWL